MVKNRPHGNNPCDPLRDFTFRQATGDQIRNALEQDINPFTKARWSERYRQQKLLRVRKNLPVFGYMDRFLDALRNHQVIIVHGDTGTGKTTQIPQFVAYADLPQSSKKKIVCAQTRRIAALAAARRVADEMDLNIGQEVGYSVRFDSNVSKSTFLEFMTDGMLLNEATQDRNFTKYSTIVLDEVHERTMATDILMGFLKGALSRRADLKLIIMSATMDAESLGTYFSSNNSFLLEVPGTSYPVDIVYSPRPVKDYRAATIQKILDIHRNEPQGDVLVFLTGEYEIEDMCQKVKQQASKDLPPHVFGQLICLPLYSNLPPQLQRRVWNKVPKAAPGSRPARKVVIATNIAETSLTIDGIVYIVDPGYAKPKVYDQDSEAGFESHTVRRISKASAHQRKGRAGRTRPGKCFRLYTNQEHEDMSKRELPGMQAVTLGELVLMLAGNGFTDPTTFPYLDSPDPKALIRAQRLLKHLDAIDSYNALTPLGRQMVQFPLDVQLSKMLIASPEFGCSEEIVTIAALLSAPPLWLSPHEPSQRAQADKIRKNEFGDNQSDHITLLNAYNAYVAETSNSSNVARETWCMEKYVSFKVLREAQRIRSQLVHIMRRQGIPLVSSYGPMARAGTNGHLNAADAAERVRFGANIRKALISGCFLQLAHQGGNEDKAGKPKNSFQTVRDGTSAAIHPSSLVRLTGESNWVVFHTFVRTSQPFVRTVTTIDRNWLEEYSAGVYNSEAYNDPETHAAVNCIAAQIARQRVMELEKSKGQTKKKKAKGQAPSPQKNGPKKSKKEKKKEKNKAKSANRGKKKKAGK